jgi:hypothetical protein
MEATCFSETSVDFQTHYTALYPRRENYSFRNGCKFRDGSMPTGEPKKQCQISHYICQRKHLGYKNIAYVLNSLKNTGAPLRAQAYVRQVLRSNLRQDTGCPVGGIPWFFSVSIDKREADNLLDDGGCFSIFFQFINYPTIRRCTVYILTAQSV